MEPRQRLVAARFGVACTALLFALRAQAQNPAADSAVSGALRTATMQMVEIVAPARPLGDGRFAVVAVRAREVLGSPPTAHACVATDSGGAWRAACIVLPPPTPRVDHNLFAISADTVAGWHAGDLDGDGSPEMLVRMGFDGVPQPAVGSTSYGRVYAIELAPRLRVALTIDAGLAPGSSFATIREGAVRLEDTNGDGHADLVLEGRTCEGRDALEAGRCRPLRRVYRWSAARGWAAAAR
jgi:hypothetical protein